VYSPIPKDRLSHGGRAGSFTQDPNVTKAASRLAEQFQSHGHLTILVGEEDLSCWYFCSLFPSFCAFCHLKLILIRISQNI
jgi:hypothetical protein